MHPSETPTPSLSAGHVGFVILGMKSTRDAHIGDTFSHPSTLPNIKQFAGFRPAKSMVFSGCFPIDASEYDHLKDALERLTLNDRSVSMERETSAALGQGFRLGYLGTLHMDVFRQRLGDENGIEMVNTLPTVPYLVKIKKKSDLDIEEKIVRNPVDFPEGEEWSNVVEVMEPMVLATLVFPERFLGSMIELCGRHRGETTEHNFLDNGERVIMKCRLPMAEVLTDFYDELKSKTSGYARWD
ncbi:Translation factor guf1 mitochondrial, partial [Nowakowskiella sp. JEL0078]